MKRIALIGLVAAALLTGCASTGGLPAGQARNDPARQILVTAKQPVSAAVGLVGDPATTYIRRRGYGPAPGVDFLLDEIARDYGLKRREGWQISSLGIYCEVFELAPGQSQDDVLQLVAADPRIESVQPMNVYTTQTVQYDDPYASMQPALHDLAIDSAHERATGRGVTVAVIDSLVDDRHPEMRGRVSVRRDLVSGRRPGANGEIHGTAMAGIIASAANNAIGIVGVAPDAEIVSLRACWTVDAQTGQAVCSSLSLAQALETALVMGVDIINLSLSGPDDPLLARLIDLALDRNVLVIAAMPETEGSGGDFPASHAGVIAAGATDWKDFVSFAVLRAPGNEVLSTVPDSSYGFFSGNSMSSAFIAGVAALLVERRPGIGAGEMFDLLEQTSSASAVNACLALARVVSDTACPIVSDALRPDSAALLRTPR